MVVRGVCDSVNQRVGRTYQRARVKSVLLATTLALVLALILTLAASHLLSRLWLGLGLGLGLRFGLGIGHKYSLIFLVVLDLDPLEFAGGR